MAALLNFWKKSVTPDQLRQEIYVSRLGGTLPMDMLPALKKRGLSAEVVNGDAQHVKEHLRAGRPVIAYLNFGTRARPLGHYVVMTGFDDARKEWTIHSARKKNKRASYQRFERGWRDTDHWMLVVHGEGDAVTNTAVATVTSASLSAAEYLKLGQIYDEQRQSREAAQQYNYALMLDNGYAPALLALGNQAFNEQNYRSALKYYRRILKTDGHHGGANNNIGMTYLRLEKWAAAEKFARRAAASSTHRAYGLETLAQILAKQGRWAEARAALTEARAAAGGNFDLLRQIDETERLLGH